MISALIGGPPKTTYGENIGVLAITKVYSVYVIAGAAVIATIFGFVGKVTALIQYNSTTSHGWCIHPIIWNYRFIWFTNAD